VQGSGGEVVLRELLGNGGGDGRHQQLVIVQLIIVAVSRRAPPLPGRRGIQHGASSLGAVAAGRVVGPREGSRSLSIPLDLEEPRGDGIFPCVFPSSAAGGFPGKTSRKRMARGI
jgi:hypothetical protein